VPEIRAVRWNGEAIVLIDQTRLPDEEVSVVCDTVEATVDAIVRLVVRGAPALGAVGGYGVAVAMLQGERENWDIAQVQSGIDKIRHARPTAVNLAWGVDRVRPFVETGVEAVLAEADRIAAEDEAANRELSRKGADWILANTTQRPLRILTHCNTGSLATTAWGTALGIVRELHERGEVEVVHADETRPLLQGSRLTSWELMHDGIPHVVQADSAAASTILRGLIDVAIIGADRIARNGDTANKIGSVGVALACADAGIPFVVAAPSSTVDLATQSGGDIEIELRDGSEITAFAGKRVVPDAAAGYNPAFDVTPARLISAIVTERGVVEPAPDSTVESLVAEEMKA